VSATPIMPINSEINNVTGSKYSNFHNRSNEHVATVVYKVKRVVSSAYQ